MVSSFHGLEIGKRSLLTQQAAISTTGHNIANANTKGYSRQRVDMVNTAPIDVYGAGMRRPAQLGTGVDIHSITRIREKLSDTQYRNANQQLGEWTVKQDVLQQVELLYQEPTEQGLNAVMDRFWNSWQQLSTDASNPSIRTAVKQNAVDFVDTTKSINQALTTIEEDLNENVDLLVAKANGYLENINQLNQQIASVGKGANDLKDQLDVMVDELSRLVAVNVEEQADGTYTIRLQSDNTVLADSQQWVAIGNNAGQVSVSTITGGEIAGTQQAIQLVQQNQDQLSNYVKTLLYGQIEVETAPSQTATVNGLNGLHEIGYTQRQDGNGNLRTGISFFTPSDENSFSLESLEVNPDILADPGLLATSSRNDAVNGDVALAISKLREASFPYTSNDGTIVNQSPEEFYHAFVTTMGMDVKAAEQQLKIHESLLQSIDLRRQSVSGVSIDEEMTNLFKYQHAYNAAARVVSTVDQLLDTIINRMAAR